MKRGAERKTEHPPSLILFHVLTLRLKQDQTLTFDPDRAGHQLCSVLIGRFTLVVGGVFQQGRRQAEEERG